MAMRFQRVFLLSDSEVSLSNIEYILRNVVFVDVICTFLLYV